jgi:glutamate N-acetyltransferase/amino-acid N-acetyltransferase
VIGEPLPEEKIESGIHVAAGGLSLGGDAADAFARAIMTTDTVPKSVAYRFTVGGKEIRIGGTAKGAGMVAPNMATMLCFLTTDAAISQDALDAALHDALEQSFNRITVDGHMSTNDTTVMVANSAAGNETIRQGTRGYAAFCEVLDVACLLLAKMMVRDGEGATRLVRVEVTGAEERWHATAAARAIANSPLVKTAVNGGDPNWGRVISAAGYSEAPVDENKVALHIGGKVAFEKGAATTVPKKELAAEMSGNEVHIRLDLGVGSENDTFWTCDFSSEYVNINAEYHT